MASWMDAVSSSRPRSTSSGLRMTPRVISMSRGLTGAMPMKSPRLLKLGAMNSVGRCAFCGELALLAAEGRVKVAEVVGAQGR